MAPRRLKSDPHNPSAYRGAPIPVTAANAIDALFEDSEDDESVMNHMGIHYTAHSVRPPEHHAHQLPPNALPWFQDASWDNTAQPRATKKSRDDGIPAHRYEVPDDDPLLPLTHEGAAEHATSGQLMVSPELMSADRGLLTEPDDRAAQRFLERASRADTTQAAVIASVSPPRQKKKPDKKKVFRKKIGQPRSTPSSSIDMDDLGWDEEHHADFMPDESGTTANTSTATSKMFRTYMQQWEEQHLQQVSLRQPAIAHLKHKHREQHNNDRYNALENKYDYFLEAGGSMSSEDDKDSILEDEEYLQDVQRARDDDKDQADLAAISQHYGREMAAPDSMKASTAPHRASASRGVAGVTTSRLLRQHMRNTERCVRDRTTKVSPRGHSVAMNVPL